jgi:hypothetical protein
MGSSGPSNGWRSKVLEIVVAPVITGLFVSVFLLILGPTIADRWEIRKPTCENPRGVLSVGTEQLHSIEVSSTQVYSTEEPQRWSEDKLVDGITETVWVPRDGTAKGAYVTFFFHAPQDLQLICIVNGVASNSISYLRADRVRAARVKTDPTEGPGPVSPVKSLGEFEFQNRQPLKFDEGPTRSVTITIEGIYNGVSVFEPKGDRVVEQPRTRHTALAEVEFYVRDPEAPRPWEIWESD